MIRDIQLTPVLSREREVLFRLLQYSLYEESQWDGNQIGEDGLFDYPWFECYFQEETRWAYFLTEAGTGRRLGFALVRQISGGEEPGYSMAEFLV